MQPTDRLPARPPGRAALATQATAPPQAEVPIEAPARVASLDEPTRRRLEVAAFAMGIGPRQIEARLRVIRGRDGADHTTTGRRGADAARTAQPALEALDAACIPEVRTLAVVEIILGGDPLRSASSRRA